MPSNPPMEVTSKMGKGGYSLVKWATDFNPMWN